MYSMSITRISMHSHSFKHLPISKSLSYSQAHVLGFQENSSLHSWRFMFFYVHTDTYQVALPIIKFTCTLTWDMFCKCRCFIYRFDNNKYFQFYVFHFIINTFSTSWILDSKPAPIKPVHIKDEWIAKSFIRIQIIKSWPDHAWLMISG